MKITSIKAIHEEGSDAYTALYKAEITLQEDQQEVLQVIISGYNILSNTLKSVRSSIESVGNTVARSVSLMGQDVEKIRGDMHLMRKDMERPDIEIGDYIVRDDGQRVEVSGRIWNPGGQCKYLTIQDGEERLVE